jgi:uncharacterized membrane protein YphA (DoxX/SURF4 family)
MDCAAVRAAVRLLFLRGTGGGKLHKDGFAQRFVGWGIPHPNFNAALLAHTEFICGWLIVFGIATRLASIPMIINMVVAILAVWSGVISGIFIARSQAGAGLL